MFVALCLCLCLFLSLYERELEGDIVPASYCASVAAGDATEEEKQTRLDTLTRELHLRTEECSGQEMFVRIQREDEVLATCTAPTLLEI